MNASNVATHFDNNFAGGIYELSPRGHVQVAGGLTSVLAIAFDRQPLVLSGLASPGSHTRGPDGALYLTQCSFHCAPGTGWISRVVVE